MQYDGGEDQVQNTTGVGCCCSRAFCLNWVEVNGGEVDRNVHWKKIETDKGGDADGC
jgi:hypothetical protein